MLTVSCCQTGYSTTTQRKSISSSVLTRIYSDSCKGNPEVVNLSVKDSLGSMPGWPVWGPCWCALLYNSEAVKLRSKWRINPCYFSQVTPCHGPSQTIWTDIKNTLTKTLVKDFHQTFDVEKFLPKLFALFLLCLVVWCLEGREIKTADIRCFLAVLALLVVVQHLRNLLSHFF